MNVLFLGGTRFVGRHIAESLIADGHTVTFFHRGVSGSTLFPEQRHIHGDRAGDLAALTTVPADVVIDTSGYTPDSVRASALAVEDRVRKYVFMSSIDAYDLRAAAIDESSASKCLPDGASTAEHSPELYGAHKVLCEAALSEILGPERVIAVRAGLMVGPYDHTGRFTYWPVRVTRGGEILAPVGPEMPVQIIDVRDVARWIRNAISLDLHGLFNVVGTPASITFGDVVEACLNAAPSDVEIRWAPSEFLLANDVAPWMEMPLWLPDDPDYAGLRNVQNGKARAHGLQLRPLIETVADILAEYRSRAEDAPLGAGLAPERETALLELLHGA